MSTRTTPNTPVHCMIVTERPGRNLVIGSNGKHYGSYIRRELAERRAAQVESSSRPKHE